MNQVLWLVWQNLETRSKYHVGTLIHSEENGYYIEYYKGHKSRGLHEAIEAGFTCLTARPCVLCSFLVSRL
ncbi:hypothetical protein [Shouchella shacheensis]|uniref:hypothetical protein n=1 Tax=Shouchella shacheensis TaxID=1649580 RepID=UPI00073FC23B|nr:hypothetical protein [Shouchella shacheensis]